MGTWKEKEKVLLYYPSEGRLLTNAYVPFWQSVSTAAFSKQAKLCVCLQRFSSREAKLCFKFKTKMQYLESRWTTVRIAERGRDETKRNFSQSTKVREGQIANLFFNARHSSTIV